MSRHYDKAMTKLTSKEKEAVFEHGAQRALTEALNSLNRESTELDEQLKACPSPQAAITHALELAHRTAELEAANAALQARVSQLEAQLEPARTLRAV